VTAMSSAIDTSATVRMTIATRTSMTVNPRSLEGVKGNLPRC
jgi:hypothetical protein